MIRPNDPVELHPAYWWTCHDCGRDSFVRCYAAQLSEEEMQEIEVAFEEFIDEAWEGADPIEAGVAGWHYAPHEVTCEHCSAVFPAYVEGVPRDEDRDESDG